MANFFDILMAAGPIAGQAAAGYATGQMQAEERKRRREQEDRKRWIEDARNELLMEQLRLGNEKTRRDLNAPPAGPKVTFRRPTAQGEFQVTGDPSQIESVLPTLPEPVTPEDDAVNWQTVQTDQGLVQVNPRTGETRPLGLQAPPRASGAGGGAAAKPKDLRREFTSDPVVKESATVAQAYQRVKSVADSPSGANDLALIFSFMKMLDPGSVVREGEFANAENAQGVPDRVRAMYNRVLAGERLAPEARAEFMASADQLAAGQRRLLRSAIDRFSGYARGVGVDPGVVVYDPFDAIGAVDIPGAGPIQPAPADTATAPRNPFR